MFFNPYLGQHLFEEHERRVRELYLERTALAANVERNAAMAQLAPPMLAVSCPPGK